MRDDFKLELPQGLIGNAIVNNDPLELRKLFKDKKLSVMEREIILERVSRFKDVAKAAHSLGLSRATLYRRLWVYGFHWDKGVK